MPTTLRIARPAPDEHIEYYGKYIRLVPGDDALAALETQIGDTLRLLAPLTEARALHRYAPGKWSVKEVVGHIMDSERVFAYRALRFARADQTPLPGFDENTYVPAARFDRLTVHALADELDLVRRSNLCFFRALEPEAWLRRGTANQSPVSVRALAFIIAGHGRHHVGILRERYLGKK